MKNIIFIGMPGSGKGTQSKLLEYKHISIGDLIRDEIKKRTFIGRRMEDIINKGNMVPDSISFHLLKESLNKNKSPVIIDGYPRNKNQAILLDTLLKDYIVIYLEVDVLDTIQRLSQRVNCPKCNTPSDKSQKVCPRCRKKLTKRKDDQLESILTRISVFKKEIDSIVSYYPKVFRIDGTKSKEEIHSQIMKILK